jgi:uncharacterized protein YdeI (YjbR/CyaY-like superfamily)
MRDTYEFQQIEFRSRQAIRKWLQKNHSIAGTFWLITYKKHVKERYVTYDDIVQELLCYGWIDTRTRRVDENRTMLLVAPRRLGSTWSTSNKRRVAKLIEQGLMTPLGQAKVNSAKKDGSWTFLDDVEKLIVPDDLAVALNKNNRGKRNFEAFNASARKVILLWIKTAKRQETREKRISETVRLAAKNVKAAHPEARGQ